MCLTVWWRTIRLEEKPGDDDALGKHLEVLYLKQRFSKPYDGHAEWYAVLGSNGFETLCEKLDEERPDSEKKWWISQFKTRKDLYAFLDDHFPKQDA